jgi:hypothetical protein
MKNLDSNKKPTMLNVFGRLAVYTSILMFVGAILDFIGFVDKEGYAVVAVFVCAILVSFFDKTIKNSLRYGFR